MSDTVKRKIRVFIASPGDLAEERRVFKDAIHQLNVGFGDGANVEYVPFGWEDTLASTGRRSQSVINEDVDSCDVFILAMHRRWGQEAPDAKPYSSYTEEEFHRALERWKKSGTPEVFVFFKRVDLASEADPGPQLRKVLDFRRQLENTRQVLYRYFDSHESFLNEVDLHLRAYAKGELPKADQHRDIVVLPMAALQEVEKAKATVLQKTVEAKQANEAAEKARLQLEAMQLEIAEDAAKLSNEGHIEFAREKLAKLVTETTNIRILYLGYAFFDRTGDLDSAVSVLQKWLEVSGPENRTADIAAAYGNLGNVYQSRGDLSRAEEMYQKSLAICEDLGLNEGIAASYSNLGNVYECRGELDRAEEMVQKALAIHEDIGLTKGMASDYSLLGTVFLTRGKFDRAEEMHRKALAIDEALGLKEGIANSYINLGSVYRSQGKLALAEEMYLKALPIDESIGRKGGMASAYGNLGNVYQDGEDLDRAEEMHQKALAIFKDLGQKEGMATAYLNLGNVYQSQKDLDRAEEMYLKALAINQAVGIKKGEASAYGNIGNIYLTRGELERAEEMHLKALGINQGIGRKEGMAIAYGNLGNMYQSRGDVSRAEEMCRKALIIFQEIGSPIEKQMADQLRKLRGEDPQ